MNTPTLAIQPKRSKLYVQTPVGYSTDSSSGLAKLFRTLWTTRNIEICLSQDDPGKLSHVLSPLKPHLLDTVRLTVSKFP